MYDSWGLDKGGTRTGELCHVSSSRWQMESHSYFVVIVVSGLEGHYAQMTWLGDTREPTKGITGDMMWTTLETRHLLISEP